MEICSSCHQREATVWAAHLLGVVSVRSEGLCAPCAAARVGAAPPPGDDLDAALLALGPLDFGAVASQLPLVEPLAGADELAGTAEALARAAELHGRALPPAVQAFVARHR